MNGGSAFNADLVAGIVADQPDAQNVKLLICPPFPYLSAVADAAAGSGIAVGAQYVSEHDNGAYTGEVSTMMLKELFVRYVIIGHSERRTLYGETNAIINAKIKKARAANLKPIFCIGETLEERESGKLEDVLRSQITEGLADIDEKDLREIVVAYEPVWAIGTGVVATVEQAQEAHAFCRSVIAGLYSQEIADKVRIQYGGSMKPDNAGELLAQPDIDGGLVGGASLEPQSFLDLIQAAVGAE